MATSTPFPAVEIFRAGRHIDSAGTPRTFTDADIADIATGYNATAHEAPIVVGHPETDAPAYGWVAGVRSVPDQHGARLVIDARDVEPQFAEMVRTRRFPKRSAAFYSPTHPSNPTPGKWYLRHVGFLGAAPPSVQGLKEISFTDGTGAVIFSEDESMDDEKEVARLKAQLEEAGAALAAAKGERDAAKGQIAAFAEAQKIARHAANVAFAEAEFVAGRLMPKDKAAAIAVLDVLADAAPVEFSEGDAKKTVSPVEFVKGLIAARPAAVSFGEHAPGTQTITRPETDVQLDAAARRLAAAKGCTYSEALTQIVTLGA